MSIKLRIDMRTLIKLSKSSSNSSTNSLLPLTKNLLREAMVIQVTIEVMENMTMDEEEEYLLVEARAQPFNIVIIVAKMFT